MKRLVPFFILLVVGLSLSSSGYVIAQNPGGGGTHSLYGDINADEGRVKGLKPISLDLILYGDGRTIIARQTVSSVGRYRFNNLPTGFFDLVVELEGREIARVRVDLSSPLVSERRQDLALEWKSSDSSTSKANAISAADQYKRTPSNDDLFQKAEAAFDKQRYDEAENLLKQLVANDPRDFQSWTELGTVHLLEQKNAEAENDYLRAIDLHPGFFLALLNLGRAEIAQQKSDVAVAVLSRALDARPESAEANRLLGEAYLQIKKGSQAVVYLSQAIKLDPQGMADVHLRLALLYNNAGLKNQAADEYEAFLKKRPDYPERKKLEAYISANKKTQD